jgi:hypothetical protein
MNNLDAAKIVEAVLTSMRQNPGQFNFHVNVTTVGAMGVGGPGGHGIVAVANGPGSVGFSASSSAPTQMQIQIAEQRANQELNAQFAQIQAVLEAMLAELNAQTLDRAKADSFLGQLKATWLPNVLGGVISTAIAGALGG